MAINPKIKQKAEDIRNKIFGSEVRESLASGIEAISEDVEATIGRQDYVEEQFQDVLDETTGKDVISAPELIAARNGKSNLKTRLDEEHAQVTAQLMQKAEQNEVRFKSVKINQNDVADELKQQIAGTAAINAVPAAGSLTEDRFAKGVISPMLTNFLKTGKNLYNKNTALAGYRLSTATGDMEVNADYYVSEYIPVLPGKQYIRKYGSYVTTFYDSQFVKISFSRLGDNIPYTTPDNAAYCRLSNYKTTLDAEQLSLGSVLPPYEPYKLLIPDYAPAREPFVDFDAYPFQPFATLNDDSTKSIIKKAVKRVELFGADNSKKYALGIIQRNFLTYGTGIYIAELNDDGTFNKYVANTVYTASYVIPTGVTLFDVAPASGSEITAKVWIDWNEIPTNTQYVTNTFERGGLDARTLIEQVTPVETLEISLPDVYNAVVGDTLEIFYRGVVQAVDPFQYNIKVVAQRGNAYKNRYIYSPTSAVSDFPLTISVYDNMNNLLASKTATVKTTAVKASPTTLKNVLTVGDSLTNGGVWVKELDRRFTSTGGTPEGNGLSNIEFIGTQKSGDTGYEGKGGWSWQSYNSNTVPSKYWVTVTSGMKTETISEQGVWSDGTRQWQLETIDAENNKIKFKQYPDDGSYAMPSSGTLTFVSGGGDTTDIVFSAVEAESGNPFWNSETNKLDFVKYSNDRGYSGIDYCFILLGWNNTKLTGSQLVSEGKKFVDALKAQYPNVKVGILGLQVPSIDGMGANYGAHTDWNYYEKLQKVFEFNQAYEDWAKETSYNPYLSFIHISSQFDTDNNMPTATRQVNARNSELETYGTNGVHPHTPGYYQIADAVYRKFMSLL